MSEPVATRFIITIDTETYAIDGTHPPFQTNIYAHLSEGSFGVGRIIDTCDRYGVPASFFVDVYMHHYYGTEPVRDLCNLICRSGHDVQLHAHTSWLPGSNTGRLSDFPLEHQIAILANGRNLIGEWTGEAPVAFRAGAYTANLDTIAALGETGFTLDSSYFAYHRNCVLSKQLGNRYVNYPFRMGPILELPVTSYWLLNNPSYRKISKLDINASSTAEMDDVIPKLVDARVPYIILFLHSFSFIRFCREGKTAIPNLRALQRWEALLKTLTSRYGSQAFCTAAHAASFNLGTAETENDFVPSTRTFNVIPRAVQRILG